jgi:hypothetical protein
MYASKEVFAGQRASIGRDVVVGGDHGPTWGKITDCDERRGLFIFVPPKGSNLDATGAQCGYVFKECKTVDDLNSLAPLEWTWPVRV